MAPHYDFECSSCNHKDTDFVPMSYPKITICPKCGKDSFIRLIGGSGGVIFSGDGWCRPKDYKKED